MSRALASRNTTESGSLASAGRSEPGSGAVEALRDQRFEARLAVFANRDLGAQLRARVLQLALDVGVAGIELGGELVFDQRLFELAGRRRGGARVVK